MHDKMLQEIAQQLACPRGKDGYTIGEQLNQLNAFITERAIETLGPIQGESIAEIGLGNGALSERLVETLGKEGRFLGIEHSQDMAHVARKRLTQIGKANVNIYCGSFSNVAIGRDTLDGVMAVNVFYFIEDLDSLFEKVIYWLKPKSRAVFGVRSVESLHGMPFSRFGFYIRSFEEIQSAMYDSGFARVESKYYEEGIRNLGELKIPVDSLIIKGLVN